ncbi:MAG: hypothetical protein K8T20_08030, partial [Planctomycetes bacterium]|nr:hypothetical protein [Planctomycetota bacterium]
CRRLRYRFKDYPFWGDVAAQHWQDAAKREAESKKAIAEYKAKVASGEIVEPEPATEAERMIAELEREFEREKAKLGKGRG